MSDPLTPALISNNDVSVVIMHMQGTPEQCKFNHPMNLLQLKYTFSRTQDKHRFSAGIKKNRIAIDQVLVLVKTQYTICKYGMVANVSDLGVPVLLGASRKSTIAALSNNEVANDRMAGSILYYVMLIFWAYR